MPRLKLETAPKKARGTVAAKKVRGIAAKKVRGTVAAKKVRGAVAKRGGREIVFVEDSFVDELMASVAIPDIEGELKELYEDMDMSVDSEDVLDLCSSVGSTSTPSDVGPVKPDPAAAGQDQSIALECPECETISFEAIKCPKCRTLLRTGINHAGLRFHLGQDIYFLSDGLSSLPYQGDIVHIPSARTVEVRYKDTQWRFEQCDEKKNINDIALYIDSLLSRDQRSQRGRPVQRFIDVQCSGGDGYRYRDKERNQRQYCHHCKEPVLVQGNKKICVSCDGRSEKKYKFAVGQSVFFRNKNNTLNAGRVIKIKGPSEAEVGYKGTWKDKRYNEVRPMSDIAATIEELTDQISARTRRAPVDVMAIRLAKEEEELERKQLERKEKEELRRAQALKEAEIEKKKTELEKLRLKKLKEKELLRDKEKKLRMKERERRRREVLRERERARRERERDRRRDKLRLSKAKAEASNIKKKRQLKLKALVPQNCISEVIVLNGFGSLSEWKAARKRCAQIQSVDSFRLNFSKWASITLLWFIIYW